LAREYEEKMAKAKFDKEYLQRLQEEADKKLADEIFAQEE